MAKVYHTQPWLILANHGYSITHCGTFNHGQPQSMIVNHGLPHATIFNHRQPYETIGNLEPLTLGEN